MPQPNKIPKAFAASGDRNIIPESTGTLGLASWNEGFPAITSVPFSEGGLAPKRADFNGVFNALSAATVWQQQGGLWAYDNSTDYEIGNVVVYNSKLYMCVAANGPSSAINTPTQSNFWKQIMNSADVSEAYLAKTGGTLTGWLRFQQADGDARIVNNTTTYTETLSIYGGAGYATGAYIEVCGKSHASRPGQFRVVATDGTNTSTLTGYPTGALTWGSANVVTTNGADFTGQVTAQTPVTTDDSTKVATTAFVKRSFEQGAFNAMFFSQTSGNYTAPYTGVYRITLKGGGGGGGGAQTDRYATGGAGGEGGTIIFYETLTKDTLYAYTIGAGGAAGANGATNTDAQNGSDGGTSSIIIGSTTYSITGGEGGKRRYSNGRGGIGGRTKTPNNNSVYMIPGTSGGNGTAVNSDAISATGYICTLVQGAGCSQLSLPSLFGSGGNGGGPLANAMTSTPLEPTAGGDGYILIEYAG